MDKLTKTGATLRCELFQKFWTKMIIFYSNNEIKLKRYKCLNHRLFYIQSAVSDSNSAQFKQHLKLCMHNYGETFRNYILHKKAVYIDYRVYTSAAKI